MNRVHVHAHRLAGLLAGLAGTLLALGAGAPAAFALPQPIPDPGGGPGSPAPAGAHPAVAPPSGVVLRFEGPSSPPRRSRTPRSRPTSTPPPPAAWPAGRSPSSRSRPRWPRPPSPSSRTGHSPHDAASARQRHDPGARHQPARPEHPPPRGLEPRPGPTAGVTPAKTSGFAPRTGRSARRQALRCNGCQPRRVGDLAAAAMDQAVGRIPPNGTTDNE